MKKILFPLLILLVLLWVSPVSAEVVYEPGDTLTASFSFSSAEAVFARIGFRYDHEALTFAGASTATASPVTGDGYFIFGNGTQAIGSVTFSITFTVKKQAASGTYFVTPYLEECYTATTQDTIGSISPKACSYTIEACKHILIPSVSTQATSAKNGTRGVMFCVNCFFEAISQKTLPSDKALILPADLTSIGDEAFMNTDIAQVTIPSGCTSIGKKAFSGCKSLLCAFLPDSLASIASDAFEGCEDLLLCCSSANTYVISWADQNGFIVNTVSMK